jgi:hypothetical protein
MSVDVNRFTHYENNLWSPSMGGRDGETEACYTTTVNKFVDWPQTVVAENYSG